MNREPEGMYNGKPLYRVASPQNSCTFVAAGEKFTCALEHTPVGTCPATHINGSCRAGKNGILLLKHELPRLMSAKMRS